MTKGERVKLFRDLWPAACLANEWDIKDDTKRREVILECMELVRGPLDELDPDEVSKRHMSFAKRHQKKMSKEGKKQPKQAEMSLPESRQRQTTPQVPVTEEAPF